MHICEGILWATIATFTGFMVLGIFLPEEPPSARVYAEAIHATMKAQGFRVTGPEPGLLPGDWVIRLDLTPYMDDITPEEADGLREGLGPEWVQAPSGECGITRVFMNKECGLWLLFMRDRSGTPAHVQFVLTRRNQ